MSGLWPGLTLAQGFLEDQREGEDVLDEGGGIGEIGKLMGLVNVLSEGVLSQEKESHQSSNSERRWVMLRL